jgi:O-antigen ligase
MAARLVPVNWFFALAFAGLAMFVGLLAGYDPKFAIAASFGIAFALVVFANLTAGLALFSFLSFLEVFGQSSVLSVGKLGGLVLAMGWLAVVVTRDQARDSFITEYPGVSLILGLFLGWVALSALWAEATPVVLGAFGRFLLNVILFMIVFTAIRTREQAVMVVGGFVAGAATAAVYGLVFATHQRVGYGGRITGAGLDPNELASVLVAGIALSIGVAACLKHRPGLRIATLFGGGFCFLAALLTGSRGGIVAMACMLIAALFIAGRWRGRILVAGVLAVVIGTYYIAALAPAEIRERIASSGNGQTREMEGRTTLWEIADRMIEAHPVNGVGAGNFEVSSKHYLLQPGAIYRSDVVIREPQVAHNTYLHITAELGVVGLAMFAAVLVFSVGCAIRAAGHFRDRGDPSGEALARCIAIAMIGVLVADTFISQQFNKQLWMLLGIGPAILAVARRPPAGDATA